MIISKIMSSNTVPATQLLAGDFVEVVFEHVIVSNNTNATNIIRHTDRFLPSNFDPVVVQNFLYQIELLVFNTPFRT